MLRRPPLWLLPGLLHWTLWLFMAVVIGFQFLGVVWDSSTINGLLQYGRGPTGPPLKLEGFNDEAYADRAIVCMIQGRVFVPTPANTVLADAKLSPLVDSTGETISGFRVVKRQVMQLQPQISKHYVYVCERLGQTLAAIQDSCAALGYNITRDSLRLLGDVGSNVTHEIPRALPVLVVPYADNSKVSFYMIPGWDGSACAFRLFGSYQSPSLSYSVLRGVPRAMRETMVSQWVGQPGGQWRNGWYEAPDGKRWFSNMGSSNTKQPYGILDRQFDTAANSEMDCSLSSAPPSCKPGLVIESWNAELTQTTRLTQQSQLIVSNGARFGWFLFEAVTVTDVKISHSLQTFISNVSVLVLLTRWFVTLAAMLLTFKRGAGPWQTTSIGCLSSSRTFNALPLLLATRLKTTLCVFFTAGCFFEGQQSAFSTAWFIIYPGLVEFMLYYFSLLNILAKFSYRRMSDVLFAPTLVVFCALHYFRKSVSASGIFGLSSRVATQIMSNEVDALTLPDFVLTDAAMRINGNLTPIFYFKIALLVLNLVPLLLAENMTERKNKKLQTVPPCGLERVLALRAANVGGLGQSPVYAARLAPRVRRSSSEWSVVPFTNRPGDKNKKEEQAETGPSHVLVGYEINRLGYVVFGGKFLLTYDDWYTLTTMAPLRVIEKLWNCRVVVFDVVQNRDNGNFRVVRTPRFCRLDDRELRAVPFFDVMVVDFE